MKGAGADRNAAKGIRRFSSMKFWRHQEREAVGFESATTGVRGIDVAISDSKITFPRLYIYIYIYNMGNTYFDDAVLRFGVNYNHLVLSPLHSVLYRQRGKNLIEGQRTSLQQDKETELVDPGTDLSW
jgi:hypothetical protein